MQPNLQTSIWLLARQLVRDYQFSVFHIEEAEDLEDEAVHLVSEQKKRLLYLRLVPIDSYWAQVVERDVTESIRRFTQMTKRIRLPLEVYNIYVLPEKPPHEMVRRADGAITMPARNALKMQNLFLDLETGGWYGSTNLLEGSGITPQVLQRGLTVPPTDPPLINDIRRDIRMLEQEREQEIMSIFRFGKPVLTFMFLFLNAVIYVLVLADGGVDNLDTLMRYGVKSNGHILEGEWWRFITPVFLHLGGLHFVFNMIALYFLGTAVERIFGSRRFLVIYLLAGISGTVASFAFTDNLSAGASGAIFGCFGALLVFGQYYPKLFFRTMGRDILFFLGLNLALGFIIPNIDNYGHIGGLIGGYFIAAFVGVPLKRGRPLWRAASGAILAAMLIFIASYGYAEGQEGTAYLAWKGQQYIQKDHVTEAEPIFERLVEMEPDNAFHHFHLGYVYSKTGRLHEAEQSWKTTLELEPNMPEAHYNLAVLYAGNGQTEVAKKHIQRASELDPHSEDIQKLLRELKG